MTDKPNTDKSTTDKSKSDLAATDKTKSDKSKSDKTELDNVEVNKTEPEQPVSAREQSQHLKSDAASAAESSVSKRASSAPSQQEPKSQEPKSKEQKSQEHKSQEHKSKQRELREEEPAEYRVNKPHFKKPDIGKLEKPTAARKQGRPVSWLAVAIALAALIASGWLYYQGELQKDQWQSWQAKQQQAFESQQELLADAREKAEKSLRAANQAETEVSRLLEKNKQLSESLSATQNQLRLIGGRQQQDWKLAEAESLLNLAQQKLTIEQNVSVAIQLLAAADQAVADVGDMTLTDIRGLIAADMQRLKAIPQADISGTIARLSAVQSQLPQLKLAALEYTPVAESLTPPQTDTQSSWQAIYQGFIKDFVTIKHHDSPVQPLMTPQQRFLLNAALRLQLERATTGLLSHNQSLFETSLKEASELIADNFAVDAATNSALETLSDLRHTPVAPLLPRQLESLEALKKTNQQRLYQWLDTLEQGPQESDAKSAEGEQ